MGKFQKIVKANTPAYAKKKGISEKAAEQRIAGGMAKRGRAAVAAGSKNKNLRKIAGAKRGR